MMKIFLQVLRNNILEYIIKLIKDIKEIFEDLKNTYTTYKNICTRINKNCYDNSDIFQVKYYDVKKKEWLVFDVELISFE